MKHCPYCAEEIQEAAIKCRYCGSMLAQGAFATEWYRSCDDRMIAGVCGGLARHFGVSVTALRLAFVILTLFVLWGAIVYAVLWIIMPVEGKACGRRATVEVTESVRLDEERERVAVRERDR